jgi:starch phosphorylase
MAIRKYVVVPPMEGGLENLREIASNLWFSWNAEAVELFNHLDEQLWDQTNHNPQQTIIRLSRKSFNRIRDDDGYQAHADKVRSRFRAYMESRRAYDYNLDRPVDFTVAYFSLEFGLTECLPIYAGGLGLLAGDHLKAASDLNLPMVGVGLMYKEGYFVQELKSDGWQTEVYSPSEMDTLPLERVTDGTGQPLRISVNMAGEELRARVLKVNVGRIALYLLDADVPDNSSLLRAVTSKLHGGDQETRIRQEILLGVGGCRVLDALGIEPDVYHLNEGHAAFALVERMRHFVRDKGLSLEEAREIVTAQSVLTIHSPVPAVTDRFERELVSKYFPSLADGLGIDPEAFYNTGRTPGEGPDGFRMTVLGLRLTSRANGVSKLHAEVARRMWREVWPNADVEDVPIVPITNGVHIPSYLSRDMSILYDRYLEPGWNEDPDSEKIWTRAEKIPDTELWRTHERCRVRLVNFARKRLIGQLLRRGVTGRELELAENALDPEALTLCFGRRFSGYSRPTLLFREPERIERIVNQPDRPVQIIFAGKAHPTDNAGKELIKAIVALAQKEPFRGRIVYIEDYDINVARYMVQGADVWLNTPRRPLEACGTSGMKAAANGALNLSTLDGWWDEGYCGDNGWTIGSGEVYDDPEEQDHIESLALYDLLEETVKPIFYDRGLDDIPREWVRMMKRSIETVCPLFNAHRMVANYVENFYVPMAANAGELKQNGFEKLNGMVVWKKRILADWDNIAILNVEVQDSETAVQGKDVAVTVTVDTAGHHPDELRVELFHGPLDMWDNLTVRYRTRLGHTGTGSSGKGPVQFTGLIPLNHTGLYGYEVRLTPEHPNLAFSHRLNHVKTG